MRTTYSPLFAAPEGQAVLPGSYRSSHAVDHFDRRCGPANTLRSILADSVLAWHLGATGHALVTATMNRCDRMQETERCYRAVVAGAAA